MGMGRKAEAIVVAEKQNPRRLRTIRDELDWQRIPGMEGRYNPRFGGACLHVENQVMKDGEYADQYDQPLLVESPGALVVATLGDKVGLVQNFRLIGPRPLLLTVDDGIKLLYGDPEFSKLYEENVALNGQQYTNTLVKHDALNEMLSGLGQMSWELPRGIAPADASDLDDFVRKVAKIEAAEEGGFEIDCIERCGEVNANTTFFAHAQAVVRAEIISVGEQSPEERETLGAAQLFSRSRVREMISSGELVDGLTIAALTIAEFL